MQQQQANQPPPCAGLAVSLDRSWVHFRASGFFRCFLVGIPRTVHRPRGGRLLTPVHQAVPAMRPVREMGTLKLQWSISRGAGYLYLVRSGMDAGRESQWRAPWSRRKNESRQSTKTTFVRPACGRSSAHTQTAAVTQKKQCVCGNTRAHTCACETVWLQRCRCITPQLYQRGHGGMPQTEPPSPIHRRRPRSKHQMLRFLRFVGFAPTAERHGGCCITSRGPPPPSPCSVPHPAQRPHRSLCPTVLQRAPVTRGQPGCCRIPLRGEALAHARKTGGRKGVAG